MNKSICVLLLSLFLYGCSENRKTEEKESVGTILPTAPNEVTTITLKKQEFNHEIVSNGKVTAQEYADLYFRTQEVIAQIYVKNGTFVRQGQKIAELDPSRLSNTLQQRENSMKQADLDLKDVLIGQGYSPDNLNAVPEEVMTLAGIKSGYEQSKVQCEASRHELEEATLLAPFDGIVANLFEKALNMAKTAEPFCRILRTGTMEVDFTVLESELPLLKIGDQVEVTPYASSSDVLHGSVTEINPIVDKNGMVKVKANVNGSGKLFDGMNVRIRVKRPVGQQLVIPKSAVVLRSGKQVAFTLKDEKAHWIYVHTGLENKDAYTVIDGLHEGDEVIVTGTVNLADETPVKVAHKD